MKQVVIMPGGFHPFHAGHYALYKQAQEAFPGADVYVAATNDTSARPFPFAVKEKLARLAGVAPGHFVQVKSPFQAREITANLDPENTQLIFVRSEKDANKPPQAGGVKKDGNPAYLQPYDADAVEPMNRHAYMAYLPTVEFGPGMTSATEIRTAWPTLNDRRKTALVMSLYPATQKNPKLAATVVKMLDMAIGAEKDITEDADKKAAVRRIQKMLNKNFGANLDIDGVLGPLTLQSINKFMPGAKIGAADDPNRTTAVQGKKIKNTDVAEDQGSVEAHGYAYNRRDQRVMWRKTFPSEQAAQAWADSKNATIMGMKAVQQHMAEDYVDEKK